MSSWFSNIVYKDVTGERLQCYPELAEFPDHRERHRAYTTAVTQAARQSSLPIVVRLGFFLPCVAGFAGSSALRIPHDLTRPSAAIALCGYILLEWRLYRWAIPRVRRELRQMLDRRAANCRACNYRLVGNTSGRCPECGTPIPADQRRLISIRYDFGLEIDPDLGVECKKQQAGCSPPTPPPQADRKSRQSPPGRPSEGQIAANPTPPNRPPV